MTRHATNVDLARHPTHWARLAARVLDVAAAAGVDAAGLRGAAGLSPGIDLWSPEQRVPLSAIYSLLEAAEEALGDPGLAIKVASGIDVEMFDALGFLVVTSPTFGVAMERTLRYQRLWNDGERYSMVVAEGRAHVRYEPFGPPRRAHRIMAEMFAFDVAVNCPRLLGDGAPAPLAVRFRAPPPAGGGPGLDVLFGAPVVYGSPLDEVLLAAELLDRPMPLANAAMHAFFRRHADSALARLDAPQPWLDRVRGFVEERLPDGGVTLASAAEALGMSVRTLQRRLRDEGTTFEELCDGVRKARALVYLDAWMSIGEVAYLLGYAEPSVFHRAFKRWTGQSPEAFRATSGSRPREAHRPPGVAAEG